MDPVKIVGIKYCGGCNPEIDRSRVAEELGACLPKGFELTPTSVPGRWDIGVLICGCATACANRPELMAEARLWIIVCGLAVDDVEVPGDRIVEAIVEKLSKIALSKS